MRVLVTGDRNWTDRVMVDEALNKLLVDSEGVLTVIQGGARGADRIALEWCLSLGVNVESYRAKWNEFGRAAGPIRNQQMLDEGQPDLVLAFHDDLLLSKGTADMVRRAKKAGVPVVHFLH